MTKSSSLVSKQEFLKTLTPEQLAALPAGFLVDQTESKYSSEGEKRRAARNRKSARTLEMLLAKYPTCSKLEFWSSLDQGEKLRLLTYTDSIVKGSARNEIGEPEESEISLTPFREGE